MTEPEKVGRLTAEETREILRRSMEDPLIAKVLTIVDEDGAERDVMKRALKQTRAEAVAILAERDRYREAGRKLLDEVDGDLEFGAGVVYAVNVILDLQGDDDIPRVTQAERDEAYRVLEEVVANRPTDSRPRS